jgi:hypothetical protein
MALPAGILRTYEVGAPIARTAIARSPMPAPTLTFTITPDRALWVTLHYADGTQSAPPRKIAVDPDRRLAGFVDMMCAFARQQLATLESSPHGRAPDREPAVILEDADGKHVG